MLIAQRPQHDLREVPSRGRGGFDYYCGTWWWEHRAGGAQGDAGTLHPHARSDRGDGRTVLRRIPNTQTRSEPEGAGGVALNRLRGHPLRRPASPDSHTPTEEGRRERQAVGEGAHGTDRLFAVDVLKAGAIAGVIAMHSLTIEQLTRSWAVFWIWQAVPVFVMVMGMNTWASAQRRLPSNADLGLTWAFLSRRLVRVLVPFTAMWVMSGIAGLFLRTAKIGWETLLLYLPVPGSGKYFVGIVVQLALLSVPLVWAFRLRPVLTTAAALVVNLGFELAAPLIPVLRSHVQLYDSCSLRYLVLFVAGMWIARALERGRPVLSPWMAGIAAPSIAYAIYVNGTGQNWVFWDAWRWQNVPAFGYSILLVAVAVRFLPAHRSGNTSRLLGIVSVASWHIFLVQAVYFGLPVHLIANHVEYLPLNLAVCIGVGVAFYMADRRITHSLGSFANRDWADRTHLR
jgi:hypothetical protein